MNHIFDLIREHGDLFYLITFVWTALEGETFVIFAGMAASHDLLQIHWLFLAAALGSLLGDQVMFFVGRFYGRRVVRRFPTIIPKLRKVLGVIEKYSASFIMSYRFMYGVRNISALAIGMSNLTWRRFFMLNSLASFLWSLVFCGVGYVFGDIMQRMGIGDEETVNFEVRSFMLSVLFIFFGTIAWRLYKAREEEKAELAAKQQAELQEPK